MKDYTEKILQSTHYVVTHSNYVNISTQRIEQFCNNTDFRQKQGTDWLEKSPFPITKLSKKEKTHLMLTFNALSFSYWGKQYWQVTNNNTTYHRGSWSLIAALLRAKEEGIEILNPQIQAKLTKKQLENILRGNRKIPLLEERHKIINQLGKIVSAKYDNNFRNMVKQSKNATELLTTIIEKFSSFEDSAIYKGEKISFYKRAQALVESMDALYQLPQIEKLTALADYILPRKLRDEGVLEYSKELQKKIDNKILIPSKSEYEIEIRANTIQAVEKIKEMLVKKNIQINSKEINDYLWITGEKEISTYHRTRTTDY